VRLQDASLLLFLAFLAALCQLLGLLMGSVPAFVVACATGIAADWLRRAFDPRPLAAWWSLPLLLAVANAAGVAALWGAGTVWDGRGYVWLAPLAAAVCAAAARQMKQSAERRCGLCNRRLGSGPAFECPRCNLFACEQHCWSFETLRCLLCLGNEVPLFAVDGRWWDRQFGPRFHQGQCQLCMTQADSTDLRTCRKCGRPQCRHCWDMANGQCFRCRWTVDALPPSLHRLLCGEPAPDR
jgi:hypothetical protein